jgi:type IV pilus assembly protein PilB
MPVRKRASKSREPVAAAAATTTTVLDDVAAFEESERPARPSDPSNWLGRVLLEQGSITEEQLEAALAEQAESGDRLGEILIRQGALREVALARGLAQQLDLPLIDLRLRTPQPEALALMPEPLVRKHRALPMAIDEDQLYVAIDGPITDATLAELSAAAGMKVLLVISPTTDIDMVIDRAYSALHGLDQYTKQLDEEASSRVTAASARVDEIDANTPIVQVVQRIITQAVRQRASDVHVEPQEGKVRIRFRVDGALHDAAELPASIAQALSSRIKIMADMNIVERRRSQDGQIEMTVDGRPLDIRVATMATIWGEKVVLRLLDRSRSLFQLGALGMSAQTQADFSRLIRSPFGMVICAGPTGSGKTTTLYAALNQIADPERNITTIEDPVEYIFPGINQIQINEQADITFAGGLKAILRQDPDVILVGEMRDVETARIAVQSALTGHFVLSSLHATDSTAALHRFLDMGIESFLVSSSVVGVVAQRLVRRICEACREPVEPPSDELAFYEEWGGKPKNEFTHGAGCNFCSHTGYVDRVGVYELLKVTPGIKQLIVEHAPRDVIWQQAIDEGMSTLRDEALRLVEEDVTTISDVLRSVYIST